MNLTCDRGDLSTAIQAVRGATPNRPAFPVLRCLLLEAHSNGKLTLTADNQEARASATVAAKVLSPGAAAVPAQIFSDVVGPLQGSQISLRAAPKGFRLSLKCSDLSSTFSGEDPTGFPRPTSSAHSFKCTVASDQLARAIEQVRFVAGREEARPALTGVLFKSKGSELTIVATDGDRLAECRLKIDAAEGSANALVPSRPLAMLGAILRRGPGTATIAVVGPDRDLRFSTSDGSLSVRLLQARYPDYSNLIPATSTTRVRLLITPLVSDLQSIAAFAQDEGRRVELRVSPTGLSVRSAHAQTGHGQASIHATVAGRPVISIVNVAYLIEALSAVDDLEAEISFNGPNRPLVVRPASGREYVHVVMPIHSQAT